MTSCRTRPDPVFGTSRLAVWFSVFRSFRAPPPPLLRGSGIFRPALCRGALSFRRPICLRPARRRSAGMPPRDGHQRCARAYHRLRHRGPEGATGTPPRRPDGLFAERATICVHATFPRGAFLQASVNGKIRQLCACLYDNGFNVLGLKFFRGANFALASMNVTRVVLTSVPVRQPAWKQRVVFDGGPSAARAGGKNVRAERIGLGIQERFRTCPG